MTGGVVIAGAGHSGGMAADALRAQGYDGPITLVGEEDALPYQRPPLSKGFLLGEVSVEQLYLKPEAFYTQKEIRVLRGVRVEAIERATRTVTVSDGKRLRYDALILATGARPRMLEAPGAELQAIHPLRTLSDVAAIRDDLRGTRACAVVGGGFIGLEIAAVLRKLGKSVTIIEAVDRLMGRAVSPEVSDYFLELHRNNGCTVLLSTTVRGFEGHDGRVRAVATSAGPVEAQLAVIGIGVIPNDQLARQSGLDTDKGIVVDLTGRTSDPHIYAIGDCGHLAHTMHEDRIRLESVQNAVDQAKLVAAAIIGKPVDYSVVPWFWSDQYDVKLQIAGIAEPGHKRIKYHDPETGTLAVYHFAGGRLRAAETVNRAGDHMSARRLIAAENAPSEAEVEEAGGDLKALLKRK